MAEYIFLFTMFTIFFFRDIQLLTTGGEPSLKGRLLAYSLMQLVAVVGFVTLLPDLNAAQFTELLRSPVVWPLSMALHLAAGLVCVLARYRAFHHTWAIALFPSPILVLSLVSVNHVLLSAGVWGERSLLSTLLWILIICTGVLALNRQLRDSVESDFIVDFAGFSNIAMVGAISVGLIAN